MKKILVYILTLPMLIFELPSIIKRWFQKD